MNLRGIKDRLEVAGFNLFAVLGRDAICEFPGLEGCGALILVGNAGPEMWRNIPPEYFDRQHPVDDFARETIERLMSRFAAGESWQLLFPGEDCPPLMSLGRIAGWHFDSPLGSGINGSCGLWFAYRAAVALSAELQATQVMSGESPCLSCESRACVRSCPAAALSFGHPPDMHLCAQYRLQSGSRCVESCLARLSCPVAPLLRYDTAQIRYHYRRALPALSRWLQCSVSDNQLSD